MDIEDAHKLKILSFEETYCLLTAFYDPENEKGEFEKIEKIFSEVSDKNEQVAYLRAKLIGKLVGICTDIFWNNREKILNGEFSKGLIDYLANPEDETLLNRILDYNEDDCYAMAAIKRYFEKRNNFV